MGSRARPRAKKHRQRAKRWRRERWTAYLNRLQADIDTGNLAVFSGAFSPGDIYKTLARILDDNPDFTRADRL